MLPKYCFKSQHGYIGLTVIVFLIALSAILYPWKPPQATTSTCLLGDPPPPNTPILRMPVAEDFGPSRSKKSDFVMVRSNIPTTDVLGLFKVPDPFLEPSQDDAHLVQTDYDPDSLEFGENPQKPGFDEFYPYGGANGLIYQEWEMAYVGKGFNVIDLGLVFFRNKDPKTIKEISTSDPKVTNHMYRVDIYQDITKVNKGPVDPIKELLSCSGPKGKTNAIKTPIEVLIPQQSKSPDQKQLQLEWFVFQSSGVWGIHCKPAVYLYPEQKQLVNVKVFPKGELSYTDPPYDADKGWSVWAEPDGKLNAISYQLSAISKFDYLYYESKLEDKYIEKPTKGWVVKFNELEDFYNGILPKLGLNEKEKKDFMDYWLTKLPQSPYYFVGLIDKPQRDYLEALEVTPNPDTSIRFSLYFETLDQPKSVIEPEIITPKRNGFTLVDWGGMVKLHPGTPFTCSQ